MAVEFREHHEKLRAAEAKRDLDVGRLYESLCPSDAVLLRPNGECPVCHRVLQRPPLQLDSFNPEARKAGIKSGLIPAGTPGLSDAEEKQAQFFARHRTLYPAQYAKPAETSEPSLAEKAKKFIRTEVSYGPKGERIETQRLIDIG